MAHRDTVESIKARPPVYGLLQAVPGLVDGGETRWAWGFNFEPETCAAGGAVNLDCHGDTEQLTATARPPVVDGDPFVVWSADRCSALGNLGTRSAEFAARALRSLQASQSFVVAHELWTGTIAKANALANEWLTSPASDVLSPTGVAMTPVGALACLEQGLGNCGMGRRGLIHVSPQLLTHLVADFAVRLQGDLWLTPTGNIVVADAGYDGSAPDNLEPTATGASQWAYATSMMRIRLSPPLTIPDGTAISAESLNKLNNTVVVYAERLAGIEWDACCHLAAEVNLPRCAFGGVS